MGFLSGAMIVEGCSLNQGRSREVKILTSFFCHLICLLVPPIGQVQPENYKCSLQGSVFQGTAAGRERPNMYLDQRGWWQTE